MAQTASPHTHLSIALPPASAHHVDLPRRAGGGLWPHIEELVLRRADHACEGCGADGSQDAVAWYADFSYDLTGQVQRLEGLVALCAACRRVKHIGRAFTNGRYQEARAHLARVNGWSEERAERYIRGRFRAWEINSEHTWTLDLDVFEHLCARVRDEIPDAAQEEAPNADAVVGTGENTEAGVSAGADSLSAPACTDAAADTCRSTPFVSDPAALSRQILSTLRSLGEGIASGAASASGDGAPPTGAETAKAESVEAETGDTEAANEATPDEHAHDEDASGTDRSPAHKPSPEGSRLEAIAEAVDVSDFTLPEAIGPGAIQQAIEQDSLEGIISQEQLTHLAAAWAYTRQLAGQISQRRQMLPSLKARTEELEEHSHRLDRLERQLDTYLSTLYISEAEGRAARESFFRMAAGEAGIKKTVERFRQAPDEFGRLARRWLTPRSDQRSREETIHLVAAAAEALWQRRQRVRRLITETTSSDEEGERPRADVPGGDVSGYVEGLSARYHAEAKQLSADEEAQRAFPEAQAFAKADEFLSTLEPQRWGQAKEQAGLPAGEATASADASAAARQAAAAQEQGRRETLAPTARPAPQQ